MGVVIRSGIGLAVALMLPMAAMAQANEPSPAKDAAHVPEPTPGMGAPGAAVPGSPELTVASVTMKGGVRASKIIGAAVFNNASQQVGTVDDLVLDHDDKAVLGVLSVGGFLGVGGKLVAVPYASLHMDANGRVTLPDATKDALSRMPGFTYE